MSLEKNGKTYYTLSGEVTKDTLSIEEQREIEEKRMNGTLTDNDRERLKWDDSLNSDRSTTGLWEKDRTKFNPNVEYYMLDYWDKEDCRWIRIPYLTMFDLIGHLRELIEDGNWFNKSSYRIHTERELDMKVKMESDDGEIHDFTLREVLFDKRYENFSELSKTDESFFKSSHQRRNPFMGDPDKENDYEEDKQEETV